jgi:hypothetical protein
MTEQKTPTLIQIDDEIREMTFEELENYETLSTFAVVLDNSK